MDNVIKLEQKSVPNPAKKNPKPKFRYFVTFYEKVKFSEWIESDIPIKTDKKLDFDCMNLDDYHEHCEREFGEDYENIFKLEEEFWDYLYEKYGNDCDVLTISKEEHHY